MTHIHNLYNFTNYACADVCPNAYLLDVPKKFSRMVIGEENKKVRESTIIMLWKTIVMNYNLDVSIFNYFPHLLPSTFYADDPLHLVPGSIILC